MVIIAVFALLVLFSIISIVMSAGGHRALQYRAGEPREPAPLGDARSPLGAHDSLTHRRPGARRGRS